MEKKKRKRQIRSINSEFPDDIIEREPRDEYYEQFEEPNENPHMLGYSSVGDTSDENMNTRNHRGFTRNIELDKFVAEKGRILITIDPISNKYVETFNHKAASKSFLQIQEEKKKVGDDQYEPIELFEQTHTSRIDGKWVNEVAKGTHKQMEEVRSAPTPKGSQPLLEAGIAKKLLGTRSEYVKGLGSGPKPTRSDSSSSSAFVAQMQYEHSIEIKLLKEELEQMKLRNKTNMDAMKAYQKEIEEKYQKQQVYMDAMKKMLEQLIQASNVKTLGGTTV